MRNQNVAKSSTRPGPRLIGRLLFAWSWLVVGALLLFVAPPVLVIGSGEAPYKTTQATADFAAVCAIAGRLYRPFDAAYAEYTPTHNTMLVFTRNVVGPMDYTPVTFTHTKNRHRTTMGH